MGRNATRQQKHPVSTSVTCLVKDKLESYQALPHRCSKRLVQVHLHNGIGKLFKTITTDLLTKAGHKTNLNLRNGEGSIVLFVFETRSQSIRYYPRTNCAIQAGLKLGTNLLP